MGEFYIAQEGEGFETIKDSGTKCQICHEACDENAEYQIGKLYHDDENIKIYLNHLWKWYWRNLNGNWYATCKALRIFPEFNCCRDCMRRVIIELGETQLSMD